MNTPQRTALPFLTAIPSGQDGNAEPHHFRRKFGASIHVSGEPMECKPLHQVAPRTE